MPPFSVKNPYCGCPYQAPNKDCLRCYDPAILETQIVYPPTKCIKRPCGFLIPPVSCKDQKETRHPWIRHSYDLTVDEPGPNDSYGLNGLNWWDWKMHDYTKKEFKHPQVNLAIPDHPYLSKQEIPADFPNVVCRLPIDCYSRGPEIMPDTPFKQPVTYTRNWRCQETCPWKPVTVSYATNRHL